RHAEDLRHFFAELSIRARLIARAPQSSSHDLFAEKLRHEGPQTDDVRDGVAVPSFREHPDTDDAADIATRWMKRSLQLLRQVFKALRIQRASLVINRP